MDIDNALNFNGLKYFYTQYIKPLKTGAFATVVNNSTTTVANTVLDGRMGKTLSDRIDTLNSTLSSKLNIMIQTSPTFNVSTTSQAQTIYFSCPSTPVAIVPYVDGGSPFMCSVNYWSSNSVVIHTQSTQNLTNRRVILVIIY